jgi:predicted metalloprotease with PDZ domain
VQPGQTVRLTIFRLDELFEVPVQVAAAPRDTVSIAPDPTATDAQKSLRAQWLGAAWPDEAGA